MPAFNVPLDVVAVITVHKDGTAVRMHCGEGDDIACGGVHRQSLAREPVVHNALLIRKRHFAVAEGADNTRRISDRKYCLFSRYSLTKAFMNFRT